MRVALVRLVLVALAIWCGVLYLQEAGLRSQNAQLEHQVAALVARASRSDRQRVGRPSLRTSSNVAEQPTTDPIELVSRANEHAQRALAEIAAASTDLNQASKSASASSQRSIGAVRDSLNLVAQKATELMGRAGG